MPVSEKHQNGENIMRKKLEAKGCACVSHGNVDGAEPDLACACEEPITLIEVETVESINKDHTKRQISIMQQYSDKHETRAAVIVTDGTNLCGIPVNEGGKQILEGHHIPECDGTYS